MAQNEAPYDPYIPSGSNGAQAGNGQNGNQRTAALQAVSGTPISWLLATHTQYHNRKPVDSPPAPTALVFNPRNAKD